MSNAEVDANVMAAVYRRGDRIMLAMLSLHLVLAACFGTFYDTWLETWLIGGIALGMFVVAMALQPGSFQTRCVAGVSLQAFVALHIYQLHGLAEMHFFFFTAFAAMIVYQDWRCMWPGAWLIIAQHVLFAVLHNQGTTVYFFEGDYIGITKLGFHFGIALFHVGLCNIWAELLRRQTLFDHRIRHDLAAAQQLAERSSAAKSEFLGNMSHELRTPMAGVLGMTELLLQQHNLTAEQRESLGVIGNSALAILDLVNDALDLSRVEAGRLELTRAPLHLRRLAEEVVELLQPRAVEHGVELNVRWQPGGPHLLVGDAGRWRQILLNLTGNAIKFAAGGHVLLDIAVTPTAVGEPASIVVRVEDDGPGIAAEVLPKLFHRFEQGGAGVYGSHGGSGLGLAISKQLVELMAGSLTVHSVPGAGTTFVMKATMPVAEAPEVLPKLDERVLLVGHREVAMAIIAEQVEAMGAEVWVAHDGESARRLLRTTQDQGHPFQLLLTDPDALPTLEGLLESLRVVYLGNPQGTEGERIVWLTRHQEVQSVVAGAPKVATRAERELPQLGLHTLLVEDDAICARVTTQMLQSLGCTVQRAEHGAKAVELCRQQRFDVILMDCRMPVMDGYQATAAIRSEDPAGERVPIIALSANSLPEDRERCLRAGADRFLTKPVTVRQLQETLTLLDMAGLPSSR